MPLRIRRNFEGEQSQVPDQLQIAGKRRRFGDDDIACPGNRPKAKLDGIHAAMGDNDVLLVDMPADADGPASYLSLQLGDTAHGPAIEPRSPEIPGGNLLRGLGQLLYRQELT